jgi:type II secretory pathway pseudopilin PulG
MRTRLRTCTGMTILELVIIIAIMLVLATLAARAVFRAKLSAQETSAIASLRLIATAQFHFSTACGSGGYSPTLGRLAIPPKGSTEAFLEPGMAQDPTVLLGGYQFLTRPGAGARLTLLDCHGLPTQSSFYASAAPVGESVGTRAFALNQAAEIWVAGGLIPPQEPFGRPSWLLK